MGIGELQKVVLGLALCASSLALATVQQHTFSVSGTSGETGAGTFTWDDTMHPDGSTLSVGDLLSLEISISGGNVLGGSDSFSLPDCTAGVLSNTPDFAIQLNFGCANGSNTFFATPSPPQPPYISNLVAFAGNSLLSWQPGSTSVVPNPPPQPETTPTAVPTMATWHLAVLCSLAGLIGWRGRVSPS